MIKIKYRPNNWDDGEGQVRRNYEEPADELQEIFEEYKKILADQYIPLDKDPYNIAYNVLEDLEKVPEIKRINSLLQLSFKDETKFSDRIWGSFLSAAYYLSDQDTIIYNTKTDREPQIGERLNSDKTLILETGTKVAGQGSKGVVINLDRIKSDLCTGNKGLCVNLGRVDRDFARDNEGVALNIGWVNQIISGNPSGMFLNLGQCDHIFLSNLEGTVLTSSKLQEDQVPGEERYLKEEDPVYDLIGSNNIKYDSKLSQFIGRLEEGLKGPVNETLDFLEEVGPNPAEKIKKKIKERTGDFN